MLSLLNGPALTSIHDYWKNQTFGLLGLVNCGKVDVLVRGGELIEDKGYFNKVCLHRPHSVLTLSLVIMVVVLLLLQERGGGHPHKGKFMTCF